MNVSDMISELNDHGFDDASDIRKMSVINSTIWDICSRGPWPFLEKTVSLTFAGGSATSATFPTDFRAATAFSVGGVNYSQLLKYIRRDDWLQRYNNVTATGTPQLFYFIGSTMYFYPVPTSSVTVQMDYISIPAALTTSSLEAAVVIPADFHREAIVNGALYKLYSMEDDTDIAPTFETYYERAIQNMSERMNLRQYQNNEYIHPMSSDDTESDGWFGI